MSIPADPSLPACVALPDLLSDAADSAANCSLHRPMAWANSRARWAKMAQINPMVAGIEAAVEDAAGGGCGSAQDGRVDEGRRVGRPQMQPVGSRPPLGPRSCPEALGSCSGRLFTPTDGVVDGRRADRAAVSQGAATIAYSFRPIPRSVLNRFEYVE